MIDLIPGTQRQELLRSLKQIRLDAQNLRGIQQFHWREYVEWAISAERQLRNQIRETDINRLILTARHHAISISPPVERILVDAEIESRIMALDDAISSFETEMARWDQAGKLVLPDTNFFIHHSTKVRETDFSELLQCRDLPVRLIVPMVIVDELDSLKRAGQKEARWRAAHTLRVLDELAGRGQRGQLAPPDFTGLREGIMPKGEVTIEILPDPPGHIRLPINDDEIVDRALSIQTIAGRSVAVVTYDTGLATRGRLAGLDVLKLSHSES